MHPARKFNLIVSIAVLSVAAVTLAYAINWPGLILMAIWPLLVIGTCIADLRAGHWEPLVLVNLAGSILLLIAYWYVPRWLWHRFRRPAPRHS